MDEIIIYWFSGTGNTLLAVKKLAEKLRHGGKSVSLVKIDLDAKPLSGKTFILCWPVYSYTMPRLVQNFVRSLPPGDNLVYMLCTMGGHAGGSLGVTGKLLAAKGYDVRGGLDLLMPNNWTGGRIPTPESVQALLAKADDLLGEFASIILTEESCNWRGNPWAEFISRVGGSMFVKGIPFMARYFKVTDKCTGCNLCAKSCPVENIEMFENRPTWTGKCELCLRCLHVCPERAIDHGGAMKRGRPQYIAPGIKSVDFLNPAE